MKTFSIFAFVLAGVVFLGALPALADGLALPWQINLQGPASPSAEHIGAFHHMLLWIISGIVLFVTVLLVWVILRYNSKVNPEPAKFSHNVLIEVIWTVVPIIILIVIAVPSLKLLYYTDRVENPEMTLKITGRQWYWDYEYPDQGGISFSAYMIADDDIDPSKGEKRLLSTDNKIVLPVETNIAIQVTAGDVLHSWAVPSLGVKIDAVPGRLNETWIRIKKPGTYFGQCSELCGKDHSFMPIEIRAVSKAEFENWTVSAKDEF